MKTQAIIEMMTTKVKSILQNHAEQLEQPFGIENAESVIKIIGQAATQAAAEGLKTYLEKNEIRANTVTHQGQKYHFNRTSDKEFHTPFGKIALKRRLYQNQEGQSFVPLDHAWNMEHQFATVEVREAVLYALALMPTSEAHPLFEKCCHFQMAESSLKKIAVNIGDDLENMVEDDLETIRQQEVVPADETKVVAVSMDGANVLLQEPAL